MLSTGDGAKLLDQFPGVSALWISEDGELLGFTQYLPGGASLIVHHTEIDEVREGIVKHSTRYDRPQVREFDADLAPGLIDKGGMDMEMDDPMAA